MALPDSPVPSPRDLRTSGLFTSSSVKSAGDFASPWSRRAKIHLSAIAGEQVKEVQQTHGAKIAGKFAGTDKKGEPSCASLRPIDGGWIVS